MKTVLIVDDKAHIRMLLEQTLDELTDLGVRLLCASNGREAVEIVQVEKPSLLILDVMMPLMNGYEVCRWVKEADEFADTHVVMLTAKSAASDRAMGIQVGADAYITKPFDPDEILTHCAEALEITL